MSELRDGAFVNVDKERADHYFQETQRLADFLEFIFDTELDYMTQSEMWKRFDDYNNENEVSNSEQTK